MCLKKISYNLLTISFVFYVRNSLEKQTENSGVLLNSQIGIKKQWKKLPKQEKASKT